MAHCKSIPRLTWPPCLKNLKSKSNQIKSSKNKTICDMSTIDRRRIAGNLPIVTAIWKAGLKEHK